jgi:L,D-transpeptidase YnhG
MSARFLGLATVLAAFFLLSSGSYAKATKTARPAPAVSYEAEARLISIYKLIGTGQARAALPLAEQLTKNFPTFQLGHLVYGDLLKLQTGTIQVLGDLPASMNKASNLSVLAELREESIQRVKALQEPPPAGTIPSQILGLTPRNKHVILVDASKSRLYLLENGPDGLKIVQNHYISVGKAGTGKYAQGDFKTPLGVYYLTTPIDPKLLAPLYGGGHCRSTIPILLICVKVSQAMAFGCTVRCLGDTLARSRHRMVASF